MDSVVLSLFGFFFRFVCLGILIAGFVSSVWRTGNRNRDRDRGWDDHGDGNGRRRYPFRVPGDSGRMCTGTDRHRMTDQEADQGVVTDRSND